MLNLHSIGKKINKSTYIFLGEFDLNSFKFVQILRLDHEPIFPPHTSLFITQLQSIHHIDVYIYIYIYIYIYMYVYLFI